MLYASAANTLSKLQIGTQGQVLISSGSVPYWTNATSATNGTVTSVGLSAPSIFTTGSPVTSSGTLSFSLNNQSANSVFAGPASGSAAQPSFRTLVASDIPAGLPYQAQGNYIANLTGDITASGPGTATATLATVNSNTGTYQGITVNGKGLVTSAVNQNYLTVASASATYLTPGSATAAYLSLASGGTVSGTITATAGVFSSLSMAGAYGFPTAGTSTGFALTSNGPTGQLTWAQPWASQGYFSNPMTAAGDMIYGGASGAPQKLASGTAGYLLYSNSGTPAWGQLNIGTSPAITGTLSSTNGGTGVNNAGKTITIAGNLTTTVGAVSIAAASGGSNVTFPTSGTLATLAGTENLTNKTLSTGSTWNGATITSQYGGTGANLSGATLGSIPYFSTHISYEHFPNIPFFLPLFTPFFSLVYNSFSFFICCLLFASSIPYFSTHKRK